MRPSWIVTRSTEVSPSAIVPIALGALLAPSLSDWWYALVTFRGQADSLEHLGAAALDADGVGFGGQLLGLITASDLARASMGDRHRAVA